jgi:xanthine dehydrogenase YagR molybdenum-binding subunit
MSAPEIDPTTMPTSNRPQNAGSSMNDDTARLDAHAKVTGRAKFGRDYYLPGSLYVAFIRCPYGAGKLTSCDSKAALAVPGVVEVSLEGRDMSQQQHALAPSMQHDGQFHGQPVGFLVAESKQAMHRGLKALNAQWEQHPVQTRISDSNPSAEAPNNATTKALDNSDVVFEAVYSTESQTHSSLETHGSMVDHRGDSATAYCSTQGTFAARDGLDDAIGLPRSKYEVVCEYVGGGFGSKLNGAGREGTTAAQVASKYQRPVYLFVDRAEEHLDTGNRPSSRTYVKLGVRNDGNIVGGQIQTWGGAGVGGRGGGVRIPSGRYDLGQIQRSHTDVRLNAGAPRPFRAPGCPQGAFAEELMLDEIAAKIGKDPVELRLQLEQSSTRKKMFKEGAELIGWDQRQANGAQSGVMRRGFGCGSASWGRFPSRAEAQVVIERDGSVEARTGTQDIGTGQRTVMGVVAADALGVPLEFVEVSIGNSNLPVGPGSGGSVTAHNTAPAMTAAARDARRQLLDAVGQRRGIKSEDLDVVEGEILQNGHSVMTWREACQQLPDRLTGNGQWNRRKQQADPSKGNSDGVQFVDLEVDTETGIIYVRRIVPIQSCGKVVCRKTAESQIIGGVIQGLSYALFEEKILDPNVGAMVNPDLEMYKIAGSHDMPLIEPVLWTQGQSGVRSLGEPPTIPTSGAIACAVYNAIGAPVRQLPLTSPRVLAAMEGRTA